MATENVEQTGRPAEGPTPEAPAPAEGNGSGSGAVSTQGADAGAVVPAHGTDPGAASHDDAPTPNASNNGSGPSDEHDSSTSVAELVKRLSEQASRLAHQEIALAKSELAIKGKRAGIGIGLFGGAALFGLYALGALCAAAIILIGRAVTPWLAAVFVAAGLGLVAGIAGLVALRKVKQAVPPVPEQTAESVKQDVEMARSRAQAGRA